MGYKTTLKRTTLKPTHQLPHCNPWFWRVCAYIVYMAQIYDFTEYKLHALMEQLASENLIEDADLVRKALDAYLLGHCSIDWCDGEPYATYANESDIEG